MYVKSRSFWATRTSAWALAAGMVVLSVSCAGADDGKRTYHIEARTTAAALNEYARQAGVAIMFDYGEAAKTTAPALNGTYTRAEALALLLANTRFVVASEVDGAVYLKVSERQVSGTGNVTVEEPTEVVVTGTRIQDAYPTSPVHVVSRKDIERSGYSQTGDLIRSLPQTFAGGQNPGMMQSPIDTNNNTFNTSTINLRGLGTDANLVLVNGHRLAAVGPYGGSDITGIPLSALARVEIVTDGASALYGSDAVAGVANFIIRKDYDGTEIGARLGAATQGGGFEQNYTLLFGRAGEKGHALMHLDYSNQDEILTKDRKVTANAGPYNTLMRPIERKSVFVNAGYSLTSRIDLSVDALVNAHKSGATIQYTRTGIPYLGFNDVRNYMLAPGVEVQLSGDWNLKADATVSRGAGSYGYAPLGGAGYKDYYRSLLKSGEVSATGTLLILPSGSVKLAIGAGYRDEDYRRVTPAVDHFRRKVSFAYAEALIPVVSPSENRTGLNRLDLTVASRVEDYDRYDLTSTYKYGVRYHPVPDLAIRGSIGTSFKAPGLSELASPVNALLYSASTMGSSTPGVAMLLVGGNVDLKPERAKTWTIGADWSPKAWSGARLSLSRFRIDYTDRVLPPVTPYTQALSNPVYASFVTLAPTPTQQAAAIAMSRRLSNYSGQVYDPNTLVALADNRKLNVSRQEIEGTDFSIRAPVNIADQTLEVFANATWLDIVQVTVKGMPERKLTGTVFNPPKTRARGGATWSVGAFTTTAIVNYVSGSRDTFVTPNGDVGSWTTLDLTLVWRPEGARALSGVDISLSLQNALDRDPPYAYGPALTQEGIAFDSANTSAIGRYVALSLKKRF